MKYCTTCSITKDISEFSKNKTKTDGFNSKCKLCVKRYRKDNAEKVAAYAKKYREDNPEKFTAINKKYRQENSEKEAARARKYRKDNAKKLAASSKEWRQKNSKQNAATKKKWDQENPDKVNARNAHRRAAKKERVPKWSNKARKAQITELYAQARKLTAVTGIQFHVDHIVPLQGKNVSGLHIPDNLQILTEHENCSKSNKF